MPNDNTPQIDTPTLLKLLKSFNPLNRQPPGSMPGVAPKQQPFIMAGGGKGLVGIDKMGGMDRTLTPEEVKTGAAYNNLWNNEKFGDMTTSAPNMPNFNAGLTDGLRNRAGNDPISPDIMKYRQALELQGIPKAFRQEAGTTLSFTGQQIRTPPTTQKPSKDQIVNYLIGDTGAKKGAFSDIPPMGSTDSDWIAYHTKRANEMLSRIANAKNPEAKARFQSAFDINLQLLENLKTKKPPGE